jgi:hypothetical protein
VVRAQRAHPNRVERAPPGHPVKAREPTVSTAHYLDEVTAARAAGNIELFQLGHVLSPLRKDRFAEREPELLLETVLDRLSPVPCLLLCLVV